MSSSFQNLPPELQQRIASITGQQPGATAPVANPPARPPSLMDHTIALRQEVAAMNKRLEAMAQVTEAVGQAVGELYQLFAAQTNSSYSDGMATAAPEDY